MGNFFVHSLKTGVQTLNHPSIKPAVKVASGYITFAAGWIQAALFTETLLLRPKQIYSPGKKPASWVETANKIADMFIKLSLILSAAVSVSGVRMISSLTGRVASPDLLLRMFGPNTIYAVNPRHPRHVASFVAVGLALPVVAQLSYNAIAYLGSKFVGKTFALKPLPLNKPRTMMTLFNLTFSRPTLHLGNQFARFILSKA